MEEKSEKQLSIKECWRDLKKIQNPAYRENADEIWIIMASNKQINNVTYHRIK